MYKSIIFLNSWALYIIANITQIGLISAFVGLFSVVDQYTWCASDYDSRTVHRVNCAQ